MRWVTTSIEERRDAIFGLLFSIQVRTIFFACAVCCWKLKCVVAGTCDVWFFYMFEFSIVCFRACLRLASLWFLFFGQKYMGEMAREPEIWTRNLIVRSRNKMLIRQAGSTYSCDVSRVMCASKIFYWIVVIHLRILSMFGLGQNVELFSNHRYKRCMDMCNEYYSPWIRTCGLLFKIIQIPLIFYINNNI